MEGVRATRANGATLRVLHLEGNGIGVKIVCLNWTLLGPTLQQLFLVNQELCDEAALHIAAGLPTLKELKVLNLSGNSVTEVGATLLSVGLASGSGVVTDLCLFGNPILRSMLWCCNHRPSTTLAR
jgi:hypothetical protein